MNHNLQDDRLDLGNAFDDLLGSIYVPYRGVLLKKLPNGFECMGIFCLCIADVDRVLNSGRASLGNSLKNKKHE